ncbi:MAG TPA: hypothetical protein DDY13_11735 [Cytophagales bacterium]|jgi:putative redox protein|nr:hypothetical protein [Cytophagales bacterium]
MINTITVKGSVEQNYRTEIECSHKLIIDQPKAAGGEDLGPNPLELFLSSLAACFCAVGKIISNQNNLGVDGIHVTVEGDIDKKYLLGKTTEGRAGFTEIRSSITVHADDMSNKEKEDFVNEISRRCPVADNIINTSKIVTSTKHEGLMEERV